MHETNVASFDLNLLVAFDALATEQHVTRAAARIGLSQPAMSHALKRLREVFDDELFVRTPHGLVPTPRAEALATVVRRTLADVDDVLAPREFDAATLRRTFVVSAPDYFEIVLLPPLLARLRREAPHVALRLRPASTSLAEDLDQRKYDLVVCPPVAAAPRLLSQKLFDDDFVVVGREGHPLLAKKKLSLDDYLAADHVQIAVRGTPGGPVDDALAKLGQRRRIALFVPHFLTAPLLVQRSDLVLTLARRIANAVAETFGLTIHEPPLELPGFSIHQMWHEQKHADPAHVWFRGLVAEVAKTTTRRR